MDTQPSMVPPPPPPPAASRRRWWIPFAVVAVLLVGSVVAGAFVSVPYYGLAPGDVRPVNDRISVEGVESFEPEGYTLFVTVSVPRLTALGAVVGWLDPYTDVVHRDVLLGDRTPEENREKNLQLMSYSKDFATYVALKRLGFPVSIENGGVVVDSLCLEQAPDKSCLRASPADEVLDPGDVITAIDGRPVNITADIAEILEGAEPGQQVKVTYVRGSDPPTTAAVTLTEGKDGRTILGIVPNPAPPSTIEFRFPIDVQIDSGQVGGPSAGLAFTLALLDELTPGELTGGRVVAATGTMELNGRVGEIGGLRQKTVAVQRAGAEVFLVPASEAAEAAAVAAGTGMEVIGVETLDDALAALDRLGGNALALGRPGAGFPAS